MHKNPDSFVVGWKQKKNNNLKAIFLNAWFVVFLHGFHEHLHVHNIPFLYSNKRPQGIMIPW